MVFSEMELRIATILQSIREWRRYVAMLLLSLLTILASWSCEPPSLALASLTDDRFDGNIFALYAGNGSLVPPRVTLAESLQRDRPALLVFYVDDSSDCKRFASVVSQLQAFYGRAADFIPIDIDALPEKLEYTATEPGYYYQGLVPQSVLLNQSGKVVLNTKGNDTFEQIDDVFREVFDLLPRSESLELRRRPINEINVELTSK